MGYHLDRARAVITRAGGDPDIAGPLARWAASIQGTQDMAAGVILGQDGTILAHTRRGGRPVAAAYVTEVTDPANADLVRLEAGLAAAALARTTGQGTIQVTYSDVCTGPGLPRMPGHELRRIRETLGLTQPDLARRLGLSVDARGESRTLREWERGREQVPVRVPAELARIAQERAEEITLLAAALRQDQPPTC